MKLSDVALPNFEFSAGQRETLDKYLPVIIVALLVWLAARGLRKVFWMGFAFFWAWARSGTSCTDARHQRTRPPIRLHAADSPVATIRASFSRATQ
jgi:hypothetical protein